jgi:hypothetical protein
LAALTLEMAAGVAEVMTTAPEHRSSAGLPTTAVQVMVKLKFPWDVVKVSGPATEMYKFWF